MEQGGGVLGGRGQMLGRGRDALRPYGRGFSCPRPPNRTCTFPRIRLSTCAARRVTPAYRCSLRCWSSTRTRALSGGGHGAPLFNSVLLAIIRCCSHAAALPHVTGFPDPGVLRRLRHDPTPAAGVAPARLRAGHTAGRAAAGRFPRSLLFAMTEEVSSYTPTASPAPQIAVSGRAPVWPWDTARQGGGTIGYGPSTTAVRPIHQIRRVADDSRGF